MPVAASQVRTGRWCLTTSLVMLWGREWGQGAGTDLRGTNVTRAAGGMLPDARIPRVFRRIPAVPGAPDALDQVAAYRLHGDLVRGPVLSAAALRLSRGHR